MIKSTNFDSKMIFCIFESQNLLKFTFSTEEVDEFYSEALALDQLGVPSTQDPKRMENFPALEGETMEVYGISDMESACDIVFSSIGWVSVTTRATLTYTGAHF